MLFEQFGVSLKTVEYIADFPVFLAKRVELPVPCDKLRYRLFVFRELCQQ